jgi:hypothetical protein
VLAPLDPVPVVAPAPVADQVGTPFMNLAKRRPTPVQYNTEFFRMPLLKPAF